ncbi:MAG: FimB/Mfa2 family fimbrial subunit [Parabacteroides sp.]|nr:FimB/Mfa2 family fimbrial subunit [Parabacteroides sp.]
MKTNKVHNMLHLLAYMALTLLLPACSFGDEPGACPYNIRMEYWYAGSSTENSLPTYVDNLRQYLFDARGNLLGTTTLRGDSVAEWNGTLPDGDYSLVLWGNLGEEGKETADITTTNDMTLNDMTLSVKKGAFPPPTAATPRVSITAPPLSP